MAILVAFVLALVAPTVAFAVGGISHLSEPRKPGEVRIAVLAFRGKESALKQWKPVADFLETSIPGRTFHVVPLTLSEMSSAVAGDEVDFVLSNPGNYVVLESKFGVTRMATLRPERSVLIGNVFGAVIVTRSDREDIQTINDLDDKSFMAVRKTAFGGFQMAWLEMKAAGIDPFTDLKSIEYVGFPQDRIVLSVLNGEVDAGTVRSGVLESMARDGRINLASARVLGSKDVEGFPYLLSTRLYPEWPIAKLRHTSQELSQKVVVALLGMDVDHPAAIASGISGWTVPLDYLPVHETLRELNIAPYDAPVEITLELLIGQYWHWLVFAGVLVTIAIFWGVQVERLVARRTVQLSEANLELKRQIEERKRHEGIAQRRQNELAHISRVNTLGELAASLAHEINQPLSAITNYAQGCVRRMKTLQLDDASGTEAILGAMQRVTSEAERAGEVIRRIRRMVRKSEPTLKDLSINPLVREAVEISYAEIERQNAEITLELEADLPAVSVDRVQIEQVLLNLIGNGLEAISKIDGPRRIFIRTDRNETDELVVSVRDNGCGVSQDHLEQMFEPFFSTKTGGMGMGLSISRTIIETCGGRLWAENTAQGGAIIRFSLPIAKEIEQKDADHAA